MDVFEALAEPRRRRMVELVAQRERTAGQIAAEFTISRPAVSQHLRVLLDAEVLAVRPVGRERRYTLRPDALQDAEDWLDAQRSRWAAALDRLEHAIRTDEGAHDE